MTTQNELKVIKKTKTKNVDLAQLTLTTIQVTLKIFLLLSFLNIFMISSDGC